MHRKYNIPQKNMKQFFTKPLRIDLGVRLDQIHIGTLLPCIKITRSQTLKKLLTKYMHTHT
jgi:hypothetical protein